VRHGRRAGAWVLAVASILAACASAESSAPTSPAAATVPAASVATTPADAAPSSTTVPSSAGSVATTDTPGGTPSSDPTSDPAPTSTLLIGDQPPTSPCAFTPPRADGEITWVHDGRLHALADGSGPTCLLDGVDASSAISWSTDAERVLLDPTRTATAKGIRATGFTADVTTVTLSSPSGSATIAVDPATRRLIRHGADGAVTDISFLDTTDVAIYHQSGTRIIAVGTLGSLYGIWLSSNLGTEPKMILSVDDPTTPVTDLALSADGQTLYFVHGFVHLLHIPILDLAELGQSGRNEANLAVSRVDGATAWTIGPCDASGSVVAIAPDADAVDLRTAARSPFADADVTLQPVGWLRGARLVLAVRASGCEGPADVWTWSVAGEFDQIAHDVLAPAVRIAGGPFVDLPNNIEQAAPG
jgi:hypothetical protein